MEVIEHETSNSPVKKDGIERAVVDTMRAM